MPVVSIKRNKIFNILGRQYTDEEFSNLLFEFGLELDEITSEEELILREKGLVNKLKPNENEVLYKIEVPANRYDLLCLEGLAFALQIFLEMIQTPRYIALKLNETSMQKIYIKENTKLIRPYIVCAILRNFKFSDQEAYNSFIDYQDKLHQTLARKRTLASIGTHDLDTVQGPFFYDALPPKSINFVPLNQTKGYSAEQLMELYSKESHLKPYLHIIKESLVYPLVYDSNGTVLSMPPIINSEHSKITLNTKNIFIDCTATDLHKAKIVVENLSAIFSCYCAKPFTVEVVEVVASDGSTAHYPEFKYRREILPVKEANRLLGTEISLESADKSLTRMGYSVHPVREPDQDWLDVEVSPLRSDVLHVRDIIEDVGIAYGYNNIKAIYPSTPTVGSQLPINKLTEILREECVAMGYTEVLTFSLCSHDEIYKKMRQSPESMQACKIGNPKTQDFEVIRTSLLPGLLKVIGSNRNVPLPIKLFEISDVVFRDDREDVKARNQRNLCAIYYNKHSGFEITHGVMDRVMQLLGIRHVSNQTLGKASKWTYSIRPTSNPTFFDGRCTEVIVHEMDFGNGRTPLADISVGTFGVLHPEVIKNFELTLPCSSLELNLQLLFDLKF